MPCPYRHRQIEATGGQVYELYAGLGRIGNPTHLHAYRGVDRQIDRLVYELYDLSEEGIRIVQKDT